MKPKLRDRTMDKLIEAVYVRQCLWDKNYSGHKNRFKLERYWKEVAMVVGISSNSCRKKWKNLKDQYRKEMKKYSTDSDWPHFKKLRFIHNQFVSDDEEDEVDILNALYDAPRDEYDSRNRQERTKRRSINVDMEKLIELVLEKELIWNRSMKGHHNSYKLDQCWNEIAYKLHCTRDEARLKWKYLRDQARKEIRKRDSEWELLPRLRFLTNQFNDFNRREEFNDRYNYLEPPAPANPNNDISEIISLSDDFDPAAVIVDTDLYKTQEDEEEQNDDKNENERDEDIEFFVEYLIPHIRRLTPDKKMILRSKMQDLVYKTVYHGIK